MLATTLQGHHRGSATHFQACLSLPTQPLSSGCYYCGYSMEWTARTLLLLLLHELILDH
uniref:Uncharacterized protein n=1 Tax=Triticum urartu TaxID=4572 RepID=A0A8R7Q424_TRIUA